MNTHKPATNNKRRATQTPLPQSASQKKLSAPEVDPIFIPTWAVEMQEEIAALKNDLFLLQDLQTENAALKSQLAKAIDEIASLKQHISSNIPSPSSPSSQPPQQEQQQKQVQFAETNESSQWQTVTHKKQKKKSQKQQKTQISKQKKLQQQKEAQQPPSESQLEWAYRGFREPEGPTGYEFIHLKTPTRSSQRTIRRRLALFGLSNKRILSVHYPTKGIVAILVHQSYAVEVKSLLQKAGIQPVAFDPTHPSVLCDPQFSNMTDAEKKETATNIYSSRISRIAINFNNTNRTHLATAIINYFHRLPIGHPFRIHDAFHDHFHNPDNYE